MKDSNRNEQHSKVTYLHQSEKLSHHRLRVWDKARELVRLVNQNPIGDAELLQLSLDVAE